MRYILLGNAKISTWQECRGTPAPTRDSCHGCTNILDTVTRRRRLVLVGLVLVGLGLPFLARNRISAALTLIEAVKGPVPRPFAPQVAPQTAEVGGVAGRIYDGGGPPILIVPGATPAGLEDMRVNVVARSLARAGRTVFIPDLDLYREQLTMADQKRIVDSVEGLAALTGGRVTIAGFSYGGSLALVAAAHPGMEGHLSRVATLGAYYDLEGVIQAITTGGSLVDGEFIRWESHPLAEALLAARTIELLPGQAQDPLLDALDGRGDPDDLSADGRALYDLLVNEDPARTGELARRLSPPLRSLIEDFSPSRVADGIDVPVLAMHSTDDPAVPYGELLRLEKEMPEAETLTVEAFQHVDFDPSSLRGWWDLVPDLWRIWRFTTWILNG